MRLFIHPVSMVAAVAGAGSLILGSALAGPTNTIRSGKATPTESPKEESAFDKLWGLAELYSDDSNPFIERLALTGRYQGQFYGGDHDLLTGDDYGYDNRRFRIGAEADLFNKYVKVKAEMFSDLNLGDVFYDGMTDLYVRVQPSEQFNLTIGKQKPKFGYEWSLSSRLTPAFERSRMTGQFRPDYTAGISADGKVGKLSYYVGGFANDPNKELAEFDGGWSGIASIAYDFENILGADTASLRLDYIHSEHDNGDLIFNNFDNGLAGSLLWKKDKLAVLTELMWGEGDAGDSMGLTIMPMYDITKKLQLVLRYQLGLSDEDTGLSPQRRYERSFGALNGDTYNAGYLGFNYFIYGHKLKLMAGAEYADMSGGARDFNGWTFLAGVRVYW